MEIHELLRVLRRRWWAVLLTTAIGFSVAAVASFTAVPTYTTTTRVFLTLRSTGSEFSLWVGGAFTRRGIGTYEDMVTSTIVLEPVIRDLGLPYTPEELAGRITVTALQTEQGVMDIRVSDSEGPRAAAIANAVVDELRTVSQRLSTTRTSDGPLVSITQTQPATAPVKPELPRIPVDLAVGILAGLLGGIVLGTRLERSDTRLRTAAAVAALSDLPVLEIRDGDAGRGRVDDVRALADSLRYLQNDTTSRVVVVATASGTGTGVGVDLAFAAVATVRGADGRVVVVDADLRGATRTVRIAPEATSGLSEVLGGRVGLDDALLRTVVEGVDLLPSGALPPNPADLLHGPRTRRLVDDLRTRYEVVVLQGAPLMPLADTSALAGLADATVVVCAPETRREQLASALERVETAGGRTVCIVFEVARKRSGPGAEQRRIASRRPAAMAGSAR